MAQQQATWTSGPSLPTVSPDDTANTIVTVLMTSVHLPKKPRKMKPLTMVLICKTNVTSEQTGGNSCESAFEPLPERHV